MILIMFIIGVIVAIAYPLYWICVKKTIPASLSETYHLLGSKGWILQGYIVLVALTIFPSWILISDNYFLLCVISVCSMLMAVNKIEGKAHIISVVISCLSALFWLILDGCWLILAVVISACLILGLKYRKWLFWCELAIICSVIISILC